MVFPKKSEYAHRESMPLYTHDNDPSTDYHIKGFTTADYAERTGTNKQYPV